MIVYNNNPAYDEIIKHKQGLLFFSKALRILQVILTKNNNSAYVSRRPEL